MENHSFSINTFMLKDFFLLVDTYVKLLESYRLGTGHSTIIALVIEHVIHFPNKVFKKFKTWLLQILIISLENCIHCFTKLQYFACTLLSNCVAYNEVITMKCKD